MQDRKKPKVSSETVKYIARLARIEIVEEEPIKQYCREFSEILDFFRELDDAPLENVEPMFHAIDIANVFREDEIGETLKDEDVLRNAAQTREKRFRVPPVI